MFSDHKYLLWIFFIYLVHSQIEVQLITNETSTMYNSSNKLPYNETFIEITSSFNCSLSVLYTYIQTY